jgi:hypothetical protein
MGRINVTSKIFEGASAPNILVTYTSMHQACCCCFCSGYTSSMSHWCTLWKEAEGRPPSKKLILGEGAVALSVTLSGGALFAS